MGQGVAHITAQTRVVDGLSSTIAGAHSIQCAIFAAGHAAVHAVCARPAGRQLIQAALAAAVRKACTAGWHLAQLSLRITPAL